MQTKQVTDQKPKSWRRFWQVTIITLVVLAVAGAYVIHRVRQLPPELMQDIRAGIAARHITDPDQRFEKFLEGRYGPLTDPANQQKAFLGFFDKDHIQAMQLLVRHSPKDQRQANINASANWVQKYRESLTSQQRADLSAHLFSPEGQQTLKQSTALYNMQDVYYREQTKPVISQLLKTIASLHSQP